MSYFEYLKNIKNSDFTFLDFNKLEAKRELLEIDKDLIKNYHKYIIFIDPNENYDEIDIPKYYFEYNLPLSKNFIFNTKIKMPLSKNFIPITKIRNSNNINKIKIYKYFYLIKINDCKKGLQFCIGQYTDKYSQGYLISKIMLKNNCHFIKTNNYYLYPIKNLKNDKFDNPYIFFL